MRMFYLIIILSVSNFVNAYSLSENSVVRLVLDSKLIVVAQVESVEIGRNNVVIAEFLSESTKVNLIALDTLKGNLDGKLTVILDTFPTYHEAVEKYKKDSKVIVFLDKIPLDRTYKNYFFHDVLRNVDDEGLEIYVKRIEEIQQILQVNDEIEQKKELIEWLVKCAENKFTRSMGLYDLNPQRGLGSYYDRKKETVSNEFPISKEQKQRLRTALFAIDELTFLDFKLINLIKEDNDRELSQFLITRFSDYDYNQWNIEKAYIVRAYMHYINKFVPNKKLRNIFVSYDINLNNITKNKKMLIDLIDEFSRSLPRSAW